MSGVGFFELVILLMIGLVVLGPKRLPQVASQLGTWIGQARRMTRAMKRQLEEELDLDDDLKNLKDLGDELKDDLTIGQAATHIPRDDDTYSPIHDESSQAVAGVGVDDVVETSDAEEESDDEAASEDQEEEKSA